MRRILVDHARGLCSAKRGGRAEHLQLDEELIFSPSKAEALVALDEPLDELAIFDARKAKVIELRYFGGLTVESARGEPPARREEFLQKACPNNPEIRAEVWELLDAESGAASFLEDFPLLSALTPGAKLGHFEIEQLVGRGGMGDVYRARNPRLNRTVAIKILHWHLSCQPRVRERFEREARAVSALNHPHVCALYDIGGEDGVDFLVMEYIEGQTLANRLAKEPLPIDQTFR